MKKPLFFFLFMTLLTGAIYPIFITIIARIIAPHSSQGSLVEVNHKVAGSLLIAQEFKDPKYFWPRPSAVNYKLPSGGSNYGLTSAALKQAIEERKKKLEGTGPNPPPEMLYASGSGLDPHISKIAAYYQTKRIAKARGWESEASLKKLIEEKSGTYVNVFELNLSLDTL